MLLRIDRDPALGGLAGTGAHRRQVRGDGLNEWLPSREPLLKIILKIRRPPPPPMAAVRPFAWVELPPLPGSPAEEAGLGQGDGVVSVGRATEVSQVPAEIVEGVPVEFVLVSPIDFELVHLTVVPRRFDPKMPHSLLGCQLVDSPAGFADPRIRAYGAGGSEKTSSSVGSAPTLLAAAAKAAAALRSRPADGDAPSYSSRLWLLGCCVAMTVLTSLTMRAPEVIDVATKAGAAPRRIATRPIFSSEIRYMVPLVCHAGGEASEAVRALSETAFSASKDGATLPQYPAPGALPATAPMAGGFSTLQLQPGAPFATPLPGVSEAGTAGVAFGNGWPPPDASMRPHGTDPEVAQMMGDAGMAAMYVTGTGGVAATAGAALPPAADAEALDSPPPFQRAAFSIAWLQLLVCVLGALLAVAPTGSMHRLRNVASIAFPMGTLLLWLLMTAAAMYCFAFQAEAEAAIHAYWRCLRPELTAALIRAREKSIRDVSADLLTDVNGVAVLCATNSAVAVAALVAGCSVISWRRVLRAGLLVGSVGTGAAGFILTALGAMLHIDGVLAAPLDVLLLATGLLVVALSGLGLYAALHEHKRLLRCYATLLISSALGLVGLFAYVLAEGLAALQGWLDRLGDSLAHAGLTRGSDAPAGLRAQELTQLVQAHRLSFALASVVVAFVMAANVALACGLRYTLRSGSRGSYGTLSLLADGDSDSSDESEGEGEDIEGEGEDEDVEVARPQGERVGRRPPVSSLRRQGR